jgi:peptide/nickel transport system substrate-binding protein
MQEPLGHAPKSVRGRLLLITPILIVTGLTGCAPGDSPGSEGLLEREDTVTILTYGDERLPNWGLGGQHLILLPLVRDSTEGGLARSWDHEPGTRTWTYHLRTDVRWHDGVSVTAHDIAFTMDLLAHPSVGRLAPGGMSYAVLNDSTIRFTYERIQGAAYPLDDWNLYYPKHLLEGEDPETFSEWDFWVRPVGNGPYRYVRHVSRMMVELEANPDHFAGKPPIERVILRFGGSPLTELRSGHVDAVATYSGLSVEDLRVLEAEPQFKPYYNWDANRRVALFWNHNHPLFSDVRVRRALSMALDRRTIARAQFYPDEIPLYDLPLSEGLLRSEDYPDPLPFDTAEAIRLLEQAGWRDEDGDGVRERGEREFRFSVLTNRPDAPILIREQYRRVGILMDVQPLTGEVLRDRIETGDFEAAFHSQRNNWGLGLWAESPEGNAWGYFDARLTDLYRQARQVENRLGGPVEDSLYLEMARIFRRDQPLTFVLPEIRFAVAHKRIQGLRSPDRYDPLLGMLYAWVEEADGNGSSAPRGPSASTQEQEDTLIALAWGGDRLLMPWVGMPTMHLMFEPLFGWDREGNVEGRLVKSWEHSPDGRTWTYHLRTDVRWHDGTPFTTKDIEFTRRGREINPLARTPDSLLILDDFTFQRVFYEAGEPLEAYNIFLPSHLLEGLDPAESWDWEFNFQPVGNGPYRYVRHVPQTMIELEANPDYYRGKPPIEHLILRLGGGEPIIELKAGNIDLAAFGTVNVSHIPSLTQDPDLEYYWKTANGVAGLFWNLRDPIISDRRVRQAVAHAVDRSEIAAVLDFPVDVPFRDVPLTEAQRLRGERPPHRPFDPERSKGLLEEAGWLDLDGDGVREKDGRPLSIDAHTGPNGIEILVMLQAQLRKVGVHLEVVTTAAVGDLLAAARRGQPVDLGEIQAVFAEWGNCPHGFRHLLGHAPERNSSFGYRNESLIQLADAMERTIIPEEMDELCRRTWPIFQEDQPFLFLIPGLWLSAAHKKVRGLQNRTRVMANRNLIDIWIDADDPGEGGSRQGGGS